jgi:hypothetical protein
MLRACSTVTGTLQSVYASVVASVLFGYDGVVSVAVRRTIAIPLVVMLLFMVGGKSPCWLLSNTVAAGFVVPSGRWNRVLLHVLCGEVCFDGDGGPESPSRLRDTV